MSNYRGTMSGKIYATIDVALDDYEQDIIDYCQAKLYPEDVFSETQLKDWAEDNGYVLESEG